ncbi:MAG: RNA 2',3'-cyclic phosphodiesterase [Phycisphaerales bacterium]|nr:RNA 2',3'-cyclic phosphodiesterase [Phycisphaerales bacterium]MCI0630620.1 RNA 2',3'-cyclic phosphodiesterase [Phycisphaerales bacterium]MCI0674199.1 RNA 2',3'-cyclic phosphodiesterase [Phycisphaerales bacterium]
MAKPSSNLRLFVAIYPPREVAEAMLKAMAELKLPAHRATLCEQVHLTLQFIGDTPARELDATIESVERAASGLVGFELSTERLFQLPERGPARLVAAQTDAPPTLMELHRRLAMRLARNVRDKKDERFRPHLTLCRFSSPTRGVKVDQKLELPKFAVEHISLMRSTLGADRAQHHEVMQVRLPG